MFTAENEDVLVAFQALCEQYPRENPVALWEMAGGQIAAEHHMHTDGAECLHKNWTEVEDKYYCYDCDSVLAAPPVM